MSERIILLHSNDIHGRIEGLARLATLVHQIEAENPDAQVIYVDAGDVEETSVRLSSLTKGTALYRLLKAAGCQAGTVGNGSILRYGYQALTAHAEAGEFPLLLANLRDPQGNPFDGVELSHVMSVGDALLGFIGVTAPYPQYETFFKVKQLEPLGAVRDLAAALLQDGVDMVILLSHLGLDDDMGLARKLQDMVALIVGAHSHDLLSEGKVVGNVLVVQAGEYAQHLGRVDLVWNEDDELAIESATVIPVDESLTPDAKVLAEVEAIETELNTFLAEPIAELAHPMDYAVQAECAMGNLAADAMRHYMQADIGIAVLGQAFSRELPAGELHRLQLWEASDASSNPGVVELTGEQLLAVVKKGLDSEFAADATVRGLRGRARGRLHLSGACVRDGKLWVGDAPIKLKQAYRVAATDFELEHFFGYTLADWQLKPEYAVPTIFREGVEDYLASAPMPLSVDVGRIQGTL